MNDTALVWFRHDLRVADNPALAAAVATGARVVPVFVDSSAEEKDWSAGAASRWWLHRSLESLAKDLRERGSRLIILRGPAAASLLGAAKRAGASRVYWNRRYEPAADASDTGVRKALEAAQLHCESFNGSLLVEPAAIRNRSGKPFQVFTAFWREAEKSVDVVKPLAAPRALRAPARWPRSLALSSLGLMPRIPWHLGMEATWSPGEAGAKARLERFLRTGLHTYREDRNLPAVEGTSRLSPHLHHGEISPRQILYAIATLARKQGLSEQEWRALTFVKELGWREFAHHVLHHFPHTAGEPMRADYAAFPWRRDARGLRAWQRGRTGVPLVDAGMRELWATGWMHNRVRMVVASFLVKNLGVRWQEGSCWFWDTLADADLANNSLNWQWVAGSGADAAPYFRVFNPVGQGQRFDPEAIYIRRWVPELASLAPKFAHAPWTAPPAELARAGVTLGRDYPRPIVDLKLSRERALESFRTMRAGVRAAKARA